VAAVVVSAIVIANAFPSSGGPVTIPTTTPTPTVTSSPTGSPKPPALKCPAPASVRAAIENATSTAGLAGATAALLQAAGYNVQDATDVGNAPSESTTTTVYFRGLPNRPAAKCIRKKFFKIADVKPMPTEGLTGTTPPIDPAVQVAVFLGSDYAAAHPV
jgi:hypothetical protein